MELVWKFISSNVPDVQDGCVAKRRSANDFCAVLGFDFLLMSERALVTYQYFSLHCSHDIDILHHRLFQSTLTPTQRKLRLQKHSIMASSVSSYAHDNGAKSLKEVTKSDREGKHVRSAAPIRLIRNPSLVTRDGT